MSIQTLNDMLLYIIDKNGFTATAFWRSFFLDANICWVMIFSSFSRVCNSTSKRIFFLVRPGAYLLFMVL